MMFDLFSIGLFDEALPNQRLGDVLLKYQTLAALLISPAIRHMMDEGESLDQQLRSLPEELSNTLGFLHSNANLCSASEI